jgi:hypothetical protein
MAVEGDITQQIQKHGHSENNWTKKKIKSPFSECQAIDLLATEKYPPQDLINWVKTEDKKTRKQDGKIAKIIYEKWEKRDQME